MVTHFVTAPFYFGNRMALRHVTPSSFPRKELGGALRIGLPSCRLVFIDIFAEILRCRSVFWSYVKSFF